MFSSNTKKNAPVQPAASVDRSAIGTIIGRDIVILGAELNGTGNVRIDGRYTGNISINGHIVIGDNGAVEGDISTNSALIAGEFKGTIKATDAVHMASTAVVDGAVESKTVIMDEDAVFNGSCIMGGSAKKEAAPAPVAPEEAEETIAAKK